MQFSPKNFIRYYVLKGKIKNKDESLEDALTIQGPDTLRGKQLEFKLLLLPKAWWTF